MSKLVFSLLLLFYHSICLENNEFKKKLPRVKLPVCISYKRPLPPDSIQSFIKFNLQSEKIEVIKWDEVMELFKQEMVSEMMNLINTDKLNETTAGNFGSTVMPVANILVTKIFRDTINNNYFSIDSIHWSVSSMPVKETNPLNHVFIPSPELKANASLVMKSFADTLLASKLLK